MQLIYARTRHLVVWLGEASEDSAVAMKTIRQVGSELKRKKLGISISQIPLWSRMLWMQVTTSTRNLG